MGLSLTAVPPSPEGGIAIPKGYFPPTAQRAGLAARAKRKKRPVKLGMDPLSTGQRWGNAISQFETIFELSETGAGRIDRLAGAISITLLGLSPSQYSVTVPARSRPCA